MGGGGRDGDGCGWKMEMKYAGTGGEGCNFRPRGSLLTRSTPESTINISSIYA